MSLLRMALDEIAYRKASFALGVLAVAVACGSLLGFVVGLRAYDVRSRQVLAEKEQRLRRDLSRLRNEMRKATLKLSFNLAVLPKDQDLREWHEKGYGTTYMPQEHVARLADSKLLIVRHFLPILQRKLKWPETKRTVILVGCRGEVPNIDKDPRAPLVQPVPDGKITLGHELHRSLALKPGQEVRLLGRSFVVHECHKARGSRDDITVWIPLADAQELLDRRGLINAILCLQCLCLGNVPIDRVRAEVAQRLPDTRVIEFGTRILARAESRLRVKREALEALGREKHHQGELAKDREGLAAVLLPVILVVCATCVWLLSFLNTRSRRLELGILRAIGYSARQVARLCLVRCLVTGMIGGLLGCLAGVLAGLGLAGSALPEHTKLLSWPWLSGSFLLAPVLAALAGWPPVAAACRQDPADILREG